MAEENYKPKPQMKIKKKVGKKKSLWESLMSSYDKMKKGTASSYIQRGIDDRGKKKK